MWQPIETAPKRGQTLILACRDGRSVRIGHWREWADPQWGPNCWIYEGKTSKQSQTNPPTHWMPLPDHPQWLERRANETFVDGLALSVRAFNVLKANGIETEEQLAALTRDQVLSFKNCGTRTADEIMNWRNARL